MIREPTGKQKALAAKLGIPTDGKTFRVISAEISDELDRRSDAYMAEHELKAGDVVKYVGDKPHMPRFLVISSYGKNCFLYFKGIHSYCRPWNVVPVTKEELKDILAGQPAGAVTQESARSVAP